MELYKFEIIKKYFYKDYDYSTIVYMLSEKHNINISLRTLKRILKNLNLKRKNIIESAEDDIIIIIIAICIELEGSGSNLGYRAMWKRLRNSYNLKVKQNTVREHFKIIDPEGVEARLQYRLKRRVYKVAGPNMLWHVDGHDKLSRYGFCIYGGIDGFYKKVIWLDVFASNHDPEVILYYYLQAVKKFGFLPTLMRSDHGTEMVLMQDAHMALRATHGDELSGLKSFLKGPSTHNQRIECYWGQCKKHLGLFYMNLFKTMEAENLLDVSNNFQKECLKFCFARLIKEDIDRTRKEWNEHRIRKQINFCGGIPNVLYHWPERYGGVDCKKPLDQEHAQVLMNDYVKNFPQYHNPMMTEFVNLLLPGFETPTTPEKAFILYQNIIQSAQDLNDN